jgi:hypothetical protein
MKNETSKTWQALGDQFHMMMGYCIAEWASVDDELFRIFRSCVGPYNQCAIIYYRMPGLNARLNCTDELVQSVLPEQVPKSGGHPHPHVTRWKEIKNRFSNLLSIRRRIAHHPITIRMSAGRRINLRSANKDAMRKYPAIPDSWFEIYVSQQEALRGGKDIPSLNVDDLQKHLFETVKLRDDLRRFFYEALTNPPVKRAPPSTPPRSET